MSFWDNVKKFAQPYSEEEFEDEYDEDVEQAAEEEQEEAPRKRRNPFGSDRTETATEAPAAAPAPSFSGQVMNITSATSRKWFCSMPRPLTMLQELLTSCARRRLLF